MLCFDVGGPPLGIGLNGGLYDGGGWGSGARNEGKWWSWGGEMCSLLIKCFIFAV